MIDASANDDFLLGDFLDMVAHSLAQSLRRVSTWEATDSPLNTTVSDSHSDLS